MKKKNQKINKKINPIIIQNKDKNLWIRKTFAHLCLVILASILFAASFPNLVFEHGIPFLAWFAFIPILVVIRKYGLLACVGWGALYGLTAYGLFNYWLGAFHPMAGTVVYSIYMVFLAVVFLFLKLSDIFFPKTGYIVQWLVWLAFEYLRTLGFLGYPYGITGYSQWQMIPLIQIASITGVWGVSALVTFPSFWLAGTLFPFFSRTCSEASSKGAEIAKNAKEKTSIPQTTTFRPLRSLRLCESLSGIKLTDRVSAIIWGAALIAVLVFGFARDKDFSSYPTAAIALVQNNVDPWEASKAPTDWQILEMYRRDLAALKRLSDEALASSPKPQMVVWSETAFIPRIYWHSTYRTDQNYWAIVRDLFEYLASKDVPFLIGNDDARRDPLKNPNSAQQFRIDYNAAMYFENGENTQIYRKLHLVPFTEHFPYQKQLPWVYNALIEADTHFWEKGDEETVFSGPGFTFSTPICFEDSFGYLSRNFVRNGADAIVNISNDAWSNSLPAQNQHLSMAIFRAVENFRPMVRATASGQTCAIDPSGRVIAEAPPFIETWLNVTIPLVSGTQTIYTAYGDYLAVFFLFMAGFLLLFGAVWCTINKLKEQEKGKRNRR